MRALKALVVGLGVVIVIAATVLATLIVQRADRLEGPPTAAAVDLPAGARVVETRLDGERLVLRLALADGGGQVLVLDLGTGRTVARIDLGPGGAAP